MGRPKQDAVAINPNSDLSRFGESEGNAGNHENFFVGIFRQWMSSKRTLRFPAVEP